MESFVKQKAKRGAAKRARKWIFTFLSCLVLFLNVQPIVADSLSDKNRRINELQDQINGYKRSIEAKRNDIANLDSQLSLIEDAIKKSELEIQAITAEIEALTLEIEQINNEIKQKEEEIAHYREVLKQGIKMLYEYGDTNDIEILAGSNSFSDFITQEEYLKAIEEKCQETLDRIKTLKAELEAKKTEIEEKKRQQEDLRLQEEAKKAELNAQAGAKTNIMNQMKGEKAQLEKAMSLSQAEKNQLVAQRNAESRRVSSGGSGGYPYGNLGMDSMVDPWGFYVRECTSYAAWYWNAHGRTWYNTQPGRGSARYWPEIASTLGYSVGSTPAVGALMIWTNGTYGHVAVVEAVYGDGTVLVSHYNYNPPWQGEYSKDIITVSNQRFIY